ncbi:MAG: PhoPQ-activated protein PqaA family protein, partial [Candidatus Hydrogenedentes bacterium]|nr:PhoPQ-activated protein PqaA family protein [Candidatus Hydrogenedentota bacterium]
MNKQFARFSGLRVVFFFLFFAAVAGATPLDDYVAAPDASYKFGPEPVLTVTDPNFTAKVWAMTSQTWLTPAEIDRPVWEHYLTIVEPAKLEHTQALMFVGGGSNRGEAPKKIDTTMAQIAVQTNSIVAVIAQIPNQPLKFPDEKEERYLERGRSEDEFIAYTWDKFMVTGDSKWPARLPMTKAVVRAMDTVQKLHPTVNGFVVCGGSKRGWTTWTVAAVDKRVVAMIPAVIDVLNMEHSMQHHF